MLQSGVTSDNNSVHAGVFKLVGTHGLPLELILQKFKEKNIVIDWVDYIKSALMDGHNPNTIKERILSAVGDIHGPIYRKNMEEKLKPYLSGR